MKKLLALAAVLLGAATWLVLAPPTKIESPPVSHRAARPALSPARRAPQTAQQPVTAAPAPQPRTLFSDEAWIRRLDDQIPAMLYSEAARCYHGGLPKDQRLDLNYKLRVRDGDLAVTGAKVEDSTIGDRALEKCIVDRVLAFRQHDSRMPDYDGDDDLYLRVGGFKPFLKAVRADGDDPAED